MRINSERNRAILHRDRNFVSYFLAGYPSTESFLDLVQRVEESELDILEIGFPSLDPYADGEVIRQAHQAIDQSEAASLAYWTKVRQTTEKPIWLMAYKNDFIRSGLYRTFAEAHLYDGLVVPDCSPEEHDQLKEELQDFGVDVLTFIRPSMSSRELQERLATSTVVYAQLYEGPTGTKGSGENYQSMLQEAIGYPNVVLFAGFGINTKEKVDLLYEEGFHGVIIGTEMLRRLNRSVEEAMTFITEIKGEL